MTKKRKTKSQKIISRLRRQVVLQSAYQNPESGIPTYSFTSSDSKKGTKINRVGASSEPRQEPIKPKDLTAASKTDANKNPADTILSYDLKLIKKDIIKTVALSLLIIATELVLYLKLG
jgi:hypothetical protein